MASLRRDYLKFVEAGTEVIVFSPEPESEFREFWQKHSMPFPGVADPRHITANLYGQEVKPFKLGRMPALFVIDRQGLIRFKHLGQSMRDIPDNQAILQVINSLNQEMKS